MVPTNHRQATMEERSKFASVLLQWGANLKELIKFAQLSRISCVF